MPSSGDFVVLDNWGGAGQYEPCGVYGADPWMLAIEPSRYVDRLLGGRRDHSARNGTESLIIRRPGLVDRE